MRNCNEIQEMLSFYLDDCLKPEEKARLEEHLKQCPECRRELEALQKTVSMISGLNDEELIPPASFRRELRKKLENEQKSFKVSFIDKLLETFNKSSFKSWMPLAAAALLLIVIMPVLMHGFGPMGAKSLKDEANMRSAPPGLGSSDGLGGGPEMDIVQEAPRAGAPKMKAEGLAEKQSQVFDSGTLEIERKIVKTAHLNLEVDNYKDTAFKINSLVQEMQGYLANENTYIYDQQRKLLAGNMSIRIPVERFTEALSRIEKMGNANNRSVNSQDVTEEYVDVESRLKAMRLKEERLLVILNKSGKLGDILAVENELARTRADIEVLEGRLRYLNNRTDLSTININIKESLTPVEQINTTGLQGVIAGAKEAFIKSTNSIIIGAGNLVVFIGGYIPFIIIILIGLSLVWIFWRKVRNKYNKDS